MISNSAAVALAVGGVMVLIYFRRAIAGLVMTLVGLGIVAGVGYAVSIFADGLTGIIVAVLLLFVFGRNGGDSHAIDSYRADDDEDEYQQRRRDEQQLEEETRMRQFHSDAISRNRW